MSAKEEAQWLEVWKLYDADKDDRLTKAELISALRVLGRRYTAEQMNRVTRNVTTNSVDYDTYVGILGDLYDGPTLDDLANAFRAFDGKDCGYFTPAQILSMLTSMGDKLTEDEAAAVMEGLPVTNGKIEIPRLMHHFCPPVPSAKPNIPELMKEIMKEELLKRDLQAQEVQSVGASSCSNHPEDDVHVESSDTGRMVSGRRNSSSHHDDDIGESAESEGDPNYDFGE
jgi:Ca2+-binding EF-hand superfamily protein